MLADNIGSYTTKSTLIKSLSTSLCERKKISALGQGSVGQHLIPSVEKAQWAKPLITRYAEMKFATQMRGFESEVISRIRFVSVVE